MNILKYIIIDWAGTILHSHGSFASMPLAVAYIKAHFTPEDQTELLVVEKNTES